MPELPEVETIAKTLKRFVVDKTIDQVDIHWPKIIKHPDDIEQFKQLINGQTIRDIHRKGKFLLFELDDYVLVSHLRMEGKYSVHPKDDPMNKHTHVIFSFTDEKQLRYHDVRKFGTMHLFEKGKELDQKPLKQLGPDPFETGYTFEYLSDKMKKTNRAIKNVLLDQTVIAGLGNIYVDETLFKSGIHPLKRANTLTNDEIKIMMKYAKETLKQAVEQGGTTIRSYVSGDGDIGMFQQQLFVYGQQDKTCKKCGHTISKIKVGGRGTHLCSTCQRSPEE